MICAGGGSRPFRTASRNAAIEAGPRPPSYALRPRFKLTQSNLPCSTQQIAKLPVNAGRHLRRAADQILEGTLTLDRRTEELAALAQCLNGGIDGIAEIGAPAQARDDHGVSGS